MPFPLSILLLLLFFPHTYVIFSLLSEPSGPGIECLLGTIEDWH
jgi:hypothetical protein